MSDCTGQSKGNVALIFELGDLERTLAERDETIRQAFAMAVKLTKACETARAAVRYYRSGGPLYAETIEAILNVALAEEPKAGGAG